MGSFTTAEGQTLRMDRLEVGVPTPGRTGELVVNGDGSVSLIITDIATDQVSYRIDSTTPLINIPPDYPIDETGNYALGDITGTFRFFDLAVSATVPVGTLTDHIWRDVHLAEFPGPFYRLDLTVETLGALFPFFMGDDAVTTGDGNDVFHDYGGDLVASLGAGNDIVAIFEGQGALTDKYVDLGDGNDRMTYQDGVGEIHGGRGRDTIGFNGGTGGEYMIDGGRGADVIQVAGLSWIEDRNSSGNDTYSGAGDNTLSYALALGGITVDLASGQVSGAMTGVDVVSGFSRFIGTREADSMSAVNAAVTFDGRNGDDTLTGNDADDTLLGGNGNDSLTGGQGNDSLVGASGNDIMTGGTGADRMNGGAGSDVFIFLASDDSTFAAAGRDRIIGFETALDVIDLSALGPLDFIGGESFTAAGQVRFVQVGTTTRVTVNLEGTSGAEMRIDLAGLHTLTEASFDLLA